MPDGPGGASIAASERKEESMPPHCDSMDGPVVKAGLTALEAGDVRIALPYVPEEGEQEVTKAFELAAAVRGAGGPAQEAADLHFFETLVRVHREGEGAAYTGLKPAGLDVGPVIPVAERAIARGSPDELVQVLSGVVAGEVRHRFSRLLELGAKANGDVASKRAYVEAMLGLQVWSHSVYQCAQAHPHEHEHDHD